MVLYLDSSFCAALYFLEGTSEVANRIVANWRGQLCISALTEVEMATACQLRVFRKQTTSAEAAAVWRAFANDVTAGVMVVDPLTSLVLGRATRLALDHSAQSGTRALDVIHVAAALSAGADQFASFDLKQRTMAKLVGLTVTPRNLV